MPLFSNVTFARGTCAVSRPCWTFSRTPKQPVLPLATTELSAAAHGLKARPPRSLVLPLQGRYATAFLGSTTNPRTPIHQTESSKVVLPVLEINTRWEGPQPRALPRSAQAARNYAESTTVPAAYALIAPPPSACHVSKGQSLPRSAHMTLAATY